MPNDAFYTNRSFLTPAFRIELDGRDAGREVISDVQEVTFTDDLDNINSFEFVLNDWNSVTRKPKYSSPWDETGAPLTLYDGGPEVPNFEPGAKVSLFLGYLEDGDLPLIMAGEVVSIAPSFPAGGAPTCRVRALDAFLRGLQKIRVEDTYSGTPKGIVDALCSENGITVQWSAIENEGDTEENVEVEGILYEEIAKRATDYGLKVMTLPAADPGQDPILYLASPSEGNDEPVADFVWGRTLISFAPALSAAGQVSAVTVRGGDASQSGSDQNIEVTRTWSDIGLSPSALGPAGAADLDTAVNGITEVIKPENVASVEDATARADARLRELAATLITGSGSSIGLPELRAGATVTLADLGARFNGTYRMTLTTHTISGAGYLTNFTARKEVLENG